MRLRFFRGNVFVANLPPEISDDRLAETFDPFGMVLSASVARDPETGKRLRYGFVDIATERAAHRAVAELNGTAIDGHKINVRISERAAGTKRPAPAGAKREAASKPDAALREAREAFPPPPRKTPQFQVERRPLPRRI